jgi:hypothetical protein
VRDTGDVGTVEGRVVVDGEGVRAANVAIGEQRAVTDHSGRFRIEDVPAGRHIVEAAATHPELRTVTRGDAEIQVRSGQTTNVEIDAGESRRQVRLVGTIVIRHQRIVRSTQETFPVDVDVELHPGQRDVQLEILKCWNGWPFGEGVRVPLRVRLSELDDRTVTVTGSADLVVYDRSQGETCEIGRVSKETPIGAIVIRESESEEIAVTNRTCCPRIHTRYRVNLEVTNLQY